MTPREAICSSWSDLLTDGPIALGYDIATTEKGTSNPSALTVSQRVGRVSMARLIVSWKTKEPEVARQVISSVLDDIQGRGMKPRRLIIDASNERYYAADVRDLLMGRCPVDLIAGGEKMEFRGEQLDAKTLLGNMFSSAIEDGLYLLPAGEWIELDIRLVKREGGRFVTELGPGGEHGDIFDGCKLSYWGLQSGGPVKADAAQVGGFGAKPQRPGVVGNILQQLGIRPPRRLSS